MQAYRRYLLWDTWVWKVLLSLWLKCVDSVLSKSSIRIYGFGFSEPLSIISDTVVVKGLHTLVKYTWSCLPWICFYNSDFSLLEWLEQILLCHKKPSWSLVLFFFTLLWVHWKFDQICWVKNIHRTTWIGNFGDSESCVNEMSFIARPLNLSWVIMSDYSCCFNRAHWNSNAHKHYNGKVKWAQDRS